MTLSRKTRISIAKYCLYLSFKTIMIDNELFENPGTRIHLGHPARQPAEVSTALVFLKYFIWVCHRTACNRWTKCKRWFFSGHFTLKSKQDVQDALWESLEIWILLRIPFRESWGKKPTRFLEVPAQSQVAAAPHRDFPVRSKGLHASKILFDVGKVGQAAYCGK